MHRSHWTALKLKAYINKVTYTLWAFLFNLTHNGNSGKIYCHNYYSN